MMIEKGTKWKKATSIFSSNDKKFLQLTHMPPPPTKSLRAFYSRPNDQSSGVYVCTVVPGFNESLGTELIVR